MRSSKTFEDDAAEAANGATDPDVPGVKQMGLNPAMSDRQFLRQLATIVSIDAAGFSRLMGLDPESAVAAFEERAAVIRDVCVSYSGEMFGDAGDSMMAEFGNPGSALLACFEFQRRIVALNAVAPDASRMPFRAGINTGTVILRGQRRYGDDVNIAARLQELAPSDGVVISETTWHHAAGISAASFRDLGEQRLKNIIFPVRAYLALRMAGEAAVDQDASAAALRTPVVTGPPAIAVLPFACANRDYDYVADGLAEDIIMGLSNTRWLPVIARGSSFQFRDDALSPVAAGRALGARYVVSGTLSVGDADLRLKVALEDVSGARMIWSRRFDRPLDDLQGMQEEIGIELVSMLEKEVDRVEQIRAFQMPWENQETWQLIRRGRHHLQRRTREDTQKAHDFFLKAHERDPNSASVLNELAWWHFWRAWVTFGTGPDVAEHLEKVAEYSQRALFVDSQDARPYAQLGVRDIMLKRPAEAIEHFKDAIRINPSSAFARSGMGSAHVLLGRPAEGLPFLLDADRLSPFDLYRFHNLGEIAVAHTLQEQWEAAVNAADRSLMLSPGYWYARFLKIGGLARLGRMDEARREVAQLRARYPDFTTDMAERIPFADACWNKVLIGNYAIADGDRQV